MIKFVIAYDAHVVAPVNQWLPHAIRAIQIGYAPSNLTNRTQLVKGAASGTEIEPLT